MLDPAAFFSYAHADDQPDGSLTRLHGALEREIARHFPDFPLFLDRDDIAWGDSWKERIDESLDNSTLLIPVLTPRFFESRECRRELAVFLERERKLDRGNLVFPIYYIDAAALESPDGDELAAALRSRQYADWRRLRQESIESPVVRERLADLAQRVSEIVARAVEARVLVVDPFGGGPHGTINAAIAAAEPGSRIVVGPGIYEESIVIDKPVELIGAGDPIEVVVAAFGARALSFRAEAGLVRNLTLRQIGGDAPWHCVDISQGRLELEHCDIASATFPCVHVHEGADPVLRHNTIHEGRTAGVKIEKQARGTLEENEIWGHRLAGVEIARGADPTLRRNRIHHNFAGVLVYDDARGTLEDNEISDHFADGLEAGTGARPAVRGNRIRRNGRFGVFVNKGGGGRFEDNDLTDNGGGPWWIDAHCVPDVVRRNNRPS